MDPGRCEPDGSMDGNFFERFPNEVLFWVASRLSSKDLGRLAQVDRRWNAIAQIPLLWENLCTDELGFRFLDRPDTTDWVGTFRNLQLSSFSTPCYQNPSATILGCVHYQRFCKIRAACCGRWFACRLCHDQASDHQMNRYRVREMYCMRCRTVQPCAPTCRNQSCASRRPLKYYCDECKLWEDNPSKDIYHCEHCGFCRFVPFNNPVFSDVESFGFSPNQQPSRWQRGIRFSGWETKEIFIIAPAATCAFRARPGTATTASPVKRSDNARLATNSVRCGTVWRPSASCLAETPFICNAWKGFGTKTYRAPYARNRSRTPNKKTHSVSLFDDFH